MLIDRDLTPLSKLRDIPVPTKLPSYRAGDAGGKRWKPIQHHDLAKTILDRSAEAGLVPVSDRWALCRGGNGLIGSIDFQKPKGLVLPRGLNLSLGVRHSNDGFWATTFAIGGRVVVCSNGMIAGEYVISKKHSDSLVLSDMVDGGLKVFLNQAKDLHVTTMALAEKDMPLHHGEHLILDAAEAGIIGWRHVEAHIKLWRTPPHPEFKPRNGWSLYNAFTEGAKDRSALNQYETFNRTRDLILAAA